MNRQVSNICVDRCVCTRQTFAELKAIAHRDGLNLVALGDCTEAGTRCRLCRPYLEEMLESGVTVFHQLLASDDA